MNWLKRTMEKIKNPEANKKLQNWQSKYDDAKTKYDAVLKDMNVNEDYYEGSKSVYGPNKLSVAPKQAINVRNIVYELIESQVDTSVPMPKVTAIHEEDEELANRIEKFLENEVRTLGFKAMNDLQERIVPVQGGDFFLIEWDSTKGTHCTIGDLAVSTIHPRNVIPQPGVVDVDKMDYIFTRTSQTKEYVKLRFGKDVSQEDETDAEIRDGATSEDLVTVITVYYKNKEGGIGLYRWCGDVMLEDMEDYQARQTEVCEKCGRRMVIKYGPSGKFLACPGFPECKNTMPYFEKIGVECPKCGKDLVLKRTRKGRLYYGCIDNPDCDFMVWQKPSVKPCPRCGGLMLIKNNKLVCNDSECGYIEDKDTDE